MPGERQRRTLDPPSQQPVTEIAVKTPQPIEVDRALINPHPLDELPLVPRAQREKRGLIHEREPIVQPRITVGRAASKGCACRTYLDWHWSASDDTDQFAVTPRAAYTSSLRARLRGSAWALIFATTSRASTDGRKPALPTWQGSGVTD